MSCYFGPLNLEILLKLNQCNPMNTEDWRNTSLGNSTGDAR